MMADNANHQDLYKQIASNGVLSISSLRQAVGSSVREEQKLQRQNIFYQRRFKVKTAHFEEVCISELEDEELVKANVKLLKDGKRTQALLWLSNALSRLARNADTFLRYDGLQTLLSCFASSNVEVLQAAAWCSVNLTAGASTSEPLLPLAPMLLQFLHSSDPLMQELCAWALGNLVGDSPANALVLQGQGCVHALMELISLKQPLACQPLKESVLFALINMAASSFHCVQDMQDHQMFEVVKVMLEGIDVESGLTFPLAWLVNTVYSRKETFARYPEQYPSVCHLVNQNLCKFCHTERKDQYKRLLVPFLHCLANITAMDANLATTTFEENPSILSSFTLFLSSHSDLIVDETLRTLANCCVSVCCRVLMSFHPKLCLALISLSQHSKPSTALQALTILDSMTKTSNFVDCHLICQGIVTKLEPLLRPGDGNAADVRDAALVVVKNLMSSCPQVQFGERL